MVMKRIIILSLLAIMLVPASIRAAQPVSAAADKPTVYLVGDAHFDTQWRWTVQTSINEYLYNTLVQNFALLDKYPDYIFNFEGAVKYAWAKEYYPDLFEKLKGYIASGRWHISGASWDANDPNIPSIESGIRNIMLGQRFYREEFGILSTDIMLPDCFGFGYQLPSVAAHCGLIGFGTQKLAWREKPFYADGRKIPFHFGIWQGLDGSRVMAAMEGGSYGWSPKTPVTDMQQVKDLIASFPAIPAVYKYFGTGDRGGSATPIGVRMINEAVQNPGPAYRMKFAASDDMFKDFLWDERLPVFDGELLMDVHATGCYTSKLEMKNLNRRNEWALGSAEGISVISDWLGGIKYPAYTLDNGWKRVIWHQFHDDLTGTSIPEAYRFSYNDEYINLRQMAGIIESGVASVASVMNTAVKGIPAVVYNPISASNPGTASVEVALPEGYRSVDVYGPDGKKVKSQVVSVSDGKATVLFAAADPSLGLSVYDLRPSKKAASAGSALKVTKDGIENRVYRIRLDANGDMVSVFDKRYGKELVRKGESFGLAFFDNNESKSWPAWEVRKEVIDRQPSKVGGAVKISAGECGPLRASIRVERQYAGSTFVQEIVLTDGAADDRIDIVNHVDWRSAASLLKASFPVSFDAPEAVYDLGMGSVARGNNTETAYEVYAHQWADMTATDASYGVTVMNDSKYGWDKPDDHTLRLTLIHTPAGNRRYEEQDSQDFGEHTFTYSIVGHKGALNTAKADIDSDCLNQAKYAFLTDAHNGALGKSFSMARSTNPYLRIKALKKAEDGDGIVVRVYELSGKGAKGSIVFNSALTGAEELNGIEDRKGDAAFSGNALSVESTGFALKTYRVRLAGSKVKINNPEYETVALPFNTVAYTTDGFTSQGELGGRKSFSGELLPSGFEYRGVPFVFGEPDYADAVRCAGQKIAVPAGTSVLHLLVAATSRNGEAVDAEFKCGADTYKYKVSDFGGFYGVYGWPGYYESSLRSDDVAYVGSHTHVAGIRNAAYEFTYMYLISIPVNGATEVELPSGHNAPFGQNAPAGRNASAGRNAPSGGNIMVFAATAEK